MGAKDQRFTIRIVAAISGAGVWIVVLAYSLLGGISVSASILAALVFSIVITSAIIILILLLNAVRGEDDEHYYPW
jgi:hypothetical protein